MLELTSSAFPPDGPIPSKYTCDGYGVSPPLAWTKVPDGTKSVALLVDDPDAPGKPFLHWLVTDLPPEEAAASDDKQMHALRPRCGRAAR